eukprot:m.89628 g.89628  ORF g.89628 m.89628 type:complete len:60 (-) comp16450_c0_seq1:1675-1854(-)
MFTSLGNRESSSVHRRNGQNGSFTRLGPLLNIFCDHRRHRHRILLQWAGEPPFPQPFPL